MSSREIPSELGAEFGKGLRNTSQYNVTRDRMYREGLSHDVLNKTPPVGTNLRLLSEMVGITRLSERLNKKPLQAAMFGLADIRGVEDMERFIRHSLGSPIDTLHIVDIDPAIIEEVSREKQKRKLDHIVPHLADARHTSLPDASLDLIIRDHTGNCCPPMIDRAIDEETARVLRPGGTSIVNITTSELLATSTGRTSVDVSNGNHQGSGALKDALRTRIYDLSQLTKEFGTGTSSLRGKLVEIEPGGFVVFGEDEEGHGEWFRRLGDHIQHWNALGFSIQDLKSRFGNDSHTPPLTCFRHNIVLEKNGGSHE